MSRPKQRTRAPARDAPAPRSAPEPARAPHYDLRALLALRSEPGGSAPDTPRSAASRRALVLASAAIVALGIALRLVWLARIGWQTPDLQWLGTPTLTSGDGYWFASGAGELLTGAWGDNPRLPLATDHALVVLTWLVTRLSPWTLDQVILYLPAVLGPLAAIPLIAIGRALGLTRLGLVAGLALVVAPAYLARSAAGYFDTDPLALIVPLVVTYHFVRFFDGPTGRHALAGALWLAAYPWLYNQGGPLGLALAITAAVAIALHARRSPSRPPWVRHALALLVLSQLPVPPLLRVPLVLLAHLVLVRLASRSFRVPRALVIGLGLGLVTLVAVQMGPTIVAKVAYFLGVDAGAGQGAAAGVSFGESADFVSETRRQGLGELGDRLAGSVAILFIEVLLVGLLAVRYPRLLLLLPVAALGAFSLFGGMRFGIYAAPIVSLGLAYGLAWLADRVPAPRLRGWVLAVLALAALTPAMMRDWVMFTRPPLVNAEVQALDALGQRARPGDTAIGWWDDGYPLLYFARTRTLVDGGRREADVGLVAEMLSSPSQRAAANLARLTIATRDGGLPPDWAIAPTLFDAALRETKLGLAAFLAHIDSAEYRAPAIDHDVYLYLPIRLLAIVPVIDALRPREVGAAAPVGGYRFFANVTVTGSRIALPSGEQVDADAVLIHEAGGTRPLRTIYSLRGSGARLELRKRSRHPDAPTSGIYLHDPGLFIELDERHLASTLVQLLVFERAEAGLFESVFSNGAARVFRLVSP